MDQTVVRGVIKDLYPTGTCFDDVGEIWRVKLDPLIRKGENLHETVRICHGIIPVGNGPEGRIGPYSHAWVLHRNDVFECKRVNSSKGPLAVVGFSKREYYRKHKITDCKEYTLREFALLQLEHGHCGPFEARYEALTNEGKRRALQS